MSDVVGKKFYNAEQPSSAFKIRNGGASVAVSAISAGNDNLSEVATPVVSQTGTTNTSKGFLTAVTNSISITPTYPKVTVV